MSFGKDPSQLTNLGAYGASTQQRMGNATRRTRGSSRSEPHWANNYRPSEGTPDLGRLIPGQFPVLRVDDNGNLYEEIIPWFEATEHFHGGLKRGIICSGGPFRMDRNKREPCTGCDIYWADWQARKDQENATGIKPKNPNRVSNRSLYIFLFLDMGYFFKMEQLDANNQIRLNPKSGKPYMEWVKYRGSHQDHLAQGREGRYGMLQAFPIGKEYFNVLNTYGDLIGANCVSCGGQSTIHVMGWNCPKCSNPIITTAQAGLSPEQIAEIVKKPNTCRSCGTTAYPQEVLTCSNCPSPRRASIFDVNLSLMRGKDPQTNHSQLMITAYSQPCGVDPQFDELLKKPPDLVKKYSPTPLAEQATILQQGGPQQPPQGPPAYQYGHHQGYYGQQPSSGPAAPPQQPIQQQPAAQQPPVAIPPQVPPGGYGNYGQQ